MFDSYLSDEDATPMTCAACGGDFAKTRPVEQTATTYSIVACAWCWRGTQTPSQRQAWERHRRAGADTKPTPQVKESGVRLRAADPAQDLSRGGRRSG